MYIPLQPAQLAAIETGSKTCIRLPLPAQPYKAGVLRSGQWDRNWLAFPALAPETGSPDCMLANAKHAIYYLSQAEVDTFAPFFVGIRDGHPWSIAPGVEVLVQDIALERAFHDPEDDYSDEGTNGLYGGEGTAAERFAREYEARTGQPLTPGTWVLRVLFKYPYAP